MKGKNCNHCGAEIEAGKTAAVCESHYRTATARVIELETTTAELLEALKSEANWLEQFVQHGSAAPVVRMGHLHRAQILRAAILKAESQ